ncbi:MAG: hypothetical protein M9887_00685 [Chitinophagales bacterium]|nr:hypothetical protein [Chitinophagales bacterium]
MEKDTIVKLNKRFEEYAYEQDGIEYWLARELQELLEYTQWRNFENVIVKAKISCENSGNAISDHFADVSKTIQMPKGATNVFRVPTNWILNHWDTWDLCEYLSPVSHKSLKTA